MNIKDVKMKLNRIREQYPSKDLFYIIFERQKELMEKYREIENMPREIDINTKKGQVWLKDFAWRITEELGEAMNCLKNKPWKQTEMLTDVDHYKEELADAFHFFIELCIISGISSEELFLLYFKKSEVNLFRQRSKY